MATTIIVMFHGENSISPNQPALISPATVSGSLPLGSKFSSVIVLSSPSFDSSDWASAFSSATSLGGVIIQAAGHNFTGYTFLGIAQI